MNRRDFNKMLGLSSLALPFLPSVIIQSQFEEAKLVEQWKGKAYPSYPFYTYQETVWSTSSWTPVDAGCETVPLRAGEEYLVMYGYQAVNAEAILLYGKKEVLGGFPPSAECSGTIKLVGNGRDTLKFQFYAKNNFWAGYVRNMVILAIPLSNLIVELEAPEMEALAEWSGLFCS